MGSQICKGSGVDVEVECMENLFPVQSKSLLKLDWTDDLALDYHCAENCRHNLALGRVLKKHPLAGKKKGESRATLKFADDIDQIFILDDMNTDLDHFQTLRE